MGGVVGGCVNLADDVRKDIRKEFETQVRISVYSRLDSCLHFLLLFD